MSPVIIVGAPRSGTNLLRDLIVTFPGCVTWPCDEINAIWSIENSHYGHDAFPVNAANEKVVRLIHAQFRKALKRFGGSRLVEKTCANSMRVEFIDKVFPEADYVFIYRNAYDAVASAEKRWHAPFGMAYSLRKLNYVPRKLLIHQICKFVLNRLTKVISGSSTVRSWGPDYGGLAEDAKNMTLYEVCAKQWAQCILNSTRGLTVIPNDRVLAMSYEELVTDPKNALNKLSLFLDKTPTEKSRNFLATVNSKSVEKGEKKFDKEQKEIMAKHIVPATQALTNYLNTKQS